jgi:MoaA/NifB/PqqE/SkfB family radical SAM enzyme
MKIIGFPIECQIFLTRKCNISCEYCVVPTKYVKGSELLLEEWFAVMRKLESWGIQHIKLLGGEPTQSPHILPLLRFLRTNTALDYLVISNSIVNDKMLRKLVDAGLSRYVTSVDDIESTLEDDIARKSNRGLNALMTLQSWGLQHLAANVVISARNVTRVHTTIEYLLKRGFGINLSPVIVGNGETYWEYRTNIGTRMRLLYVPQPHIETMVERLLELRASYPDLFFSTESYLRGLATHGVRLDWKCWLVNEGPPQLRLDSDGELMLCPDIRGNLALNVLTMSDEDYSNYLEAGWKQAIEQYHCPGCYWSSMVLSSERGVAY